MKFGVREITDVVFRSTSSGQSLGSLTTTAAYQPLLFLESAKTSTLESAVATVYAQGGRGNPRLLAWDGDKTVTFSFEEALMSPGSFAALSGAYLSDASVTNIVKLHLTEKGIVSTAGTISISGISGALTSNTPTDIKVVKLDSNGDLSSVLTWTGTATLSSGTLTVPNITGASIGDNLLVDFYVDITSSGAKKLEITADKFAGYYYIEANTLFRGTDGKDYPAQFTIPKAKVQSNFTFTMASTGDPSSFNFMLDAFPAKTRFGTKSVLFSLDISDASSDVI